MLEGQIKETGIAAERLTRLIARIDDENVIALYEREIKSLSNQRKALGLALSEIDAAPAKVDEETPNIPALIELHNAFSWDDEEWSDEKKREYLVSGGFRIHVESPDFEIRMSAGQSVSKFEESKALIAREGSGSWEKSWSRVAPVI